MVVAAGAAMKGQPLTPQAKDRMRKVYLAHEADLRNRVITLETLAKRFGICRQAFTAAVREQIRNATPSQ